MQTMLLRTLTLDAQQHPRGQGHLSAASGLARAGRYLYVAADDEHHLGRIDLSQPSAPLALLRVVEGDLPSDPEARKQAKRDFEAVTWVPPHADCPHGALLVLGSGRGRSASTCCACRSTTPAWPAARCWHVKAPTWSGPCANGFPT
jgi:hypothetical protein